jgi:hypothetical protein
MNERIAAALNPILALLKRKITRRYMGRWYVEHGELRRELRPIGWRLAHLDEPEHISDLERCWAAWFRSIEVN